MFLLLALAKSFLLIKIGVLRRGKRRSATLKSLSLGGSAPGSAYPKRSRTALETSENFRKTNDFRNFLSTLRLGASTCIPRALTLPLGAPAWLLRAWTWPLKAPTSLTVTYQTLMHHFTTYIPAVNTSNFFFYLHCVQFLITFSITWSDPSVHLNWGFDINLDVLLSKTKLSRNGCKKKKPAW